MTTRLTVDGKDVDLICGALRTAYTHTLDALASCAGGATGHDWPRREPNYRQAHKLRRQLDRLERLCADLGHPLSTSRRRTVTAYFEREVQAWQYLQNPGEAAP